MSATDELRRLLDERGVEYKDRDMFGKHVFHWGEPLHGAMFTDGGEWTELVVENATPEQAVEATLGSDLQAESAKLRELVRDMWNEGMCECGSRGKCKSCMYDYPDRIRELGVEV